jgi:glycosyltransferase involved in cell wall biosynthesis
MTSSVTSKALILLPHDSPGGAERITMIVAEAALKSDRFSEVVIFVLSRGDTGTLAHLAAYPRARLIFSQSKYMRGALFDLLRLCRQSRYDFVFSSFADLNALVSCLRRFRLLRARRLVTRESTMIFERDLGWKTPLIRGLYRLYGQQDLIVCQTERMAQSLNSHTASRFAPLLRTIPNPVSYAIAGQFNAPQSIELSDRENRIVWCGRISAVKSPLRAIETLACLHRMGWTTARLVMIGDGPMRAETEALAHQLGLGAHVEFTGFVSQPVDIMRTSRVGLMTSDVEGFPNVILEMLSTGMAGVASTDCAGGLDEIPGVVVARDKTPQALAEALLLARSQSEQSAEVREFLDARHPGVFFEQLLGSPE